MESVNKVTLDEARQKEADGSGKRKVHHYCGYCGSEMKPVYEHDHGEYPFVYRCPKCGEEELFRK